MITNYRFLLKDLPREVLNPNPWRVLMLSVQVAICVGIVALMLTVPMAWPFKLVLGLVVGHCFGINGLIGHEILHGSVVRSRRWQDVLGFVGFLPFLISPTFWRYWHNNLHHTHTQKILLDPDAYPTLRIFKHSKFMQWMFPFTPGSGHKRSYLYFFFWFSFNVQIAQFYFRFRNKMFDQLNHRKVNFELALAIALTIGYLAVVGPANWLWLVVIPFAVQNYLVFSYISTNHNLSPLTRENDPIENSLTVTNDPILEYLHVNFGYHVEHHLFPTMNAIHAKKVHQILKEKYPERYQYMPKWAAMKALYQTPRIYKNFTELIHPETLEIFPTLGYRAEPEGAATQAPVVIRPTLAAKEPAPLEL